jgi:hypothetical protein
MIDGLWVVQYEGIQGGGGTVLVFTDGQVLGGDNGFTIIGEYVLSGDIVKALVKVQNYLKSVPSFFEFEGDYEIRFNAKIEGNIIFGKAEIVDKGVSGLSVKMTRVKNLKRKV